jgi:RecA/RadA recombinase
MVTPEENTEILRRLETGGLTKPGAEVTTIGKTMAEMVEEDEPTPGWIIEGILREGGATMVYGPSGIGKTWFTHTLMLMAAAGRGAGVHNIQTDRWMLKAGGHEGVKVCLLDGEMRSADLKDRTVILCDALGLRMAGSMQGLEPLDLGQLRLALLASGEDARAVEDTIRGLREREEGPQQRLTAVLDPDSPYVDLSKIIVYPKAAQDHRVDFVDLVDTEWKHRIIEFCRAQQIKVMILDNLSTLSESLEDENAATAWIPLNSLIVALKNEGVATILVHHTNKGGEGFRGSTNIQTTLETSLGLMKLDNAKAGDGATFRVKVDKNRAGGQIEAEGKTLKLREGRWVCEVDVIDQAAKVVEMVRSLRFKTQAEIGVELGVDQATVSRIFVAAESLKLVQFGELGEKLKEARKLAKRLLEPVVPEGVYNDSEDSDIPF